jgi:hypothetical protein
MGICNPKVVGRALRPIIPALSLVAALNFFVSPAMAMSYPASTYALTVNGTYKGEGDNPFCSNTAAGSCSFIPADFSNNESSENPTYYIFTFSVGPDATDYLNVSYPYNPSSTANVANPSEELTLQIGSGPVTDYDNTTGFSVAFTDGTYSVTMGLVNNTDPTNSISLTSMAMYASTPLPGTLPLFAGGLGFVGYLTRRRKQGAKLAVA